jgi:hypothetical protein
MRNRRLIATVALLALALAVALPALGADPSVPPGPGRGKGPQASKAPKVEVALTGTVRATTDADGKVSYTLTSGGKTYTLDAGPAWFHGDKHPLKAFVGKSVTIVGDSAVGSTDVDVLSVNGTKLRAAGKPPWAGGWKHVGATHPGWSQEKADRFKAKFGDCFPPGQCKVKVHGPDQDDAEAPEATESP